MKTLKRYSILPVALMCLLLLAACANPPIRLTETATAPTPIVTMMPPPTLTPTRTPRTMGPTSTHFPTVMATPSPIPPTPLPTLPALRTTEEAAAFIIKMQETNGGCELPCWWGITPGKTTGQDAEQTLSLLRKFGESEGGMVGAIYIYSLDLHMYANLGFGVRVDTKTSNHQPVDRVSVESFTTLIDDSVRYDESWRRYFVNELLTRLGQPSEVWLGFGPYGPQENMRYFYELMVFYEHLGLTVEYAGPAVKGNPNRACLSLERLKLLRLNAQNPLNPKMVRPPGPGEPFTDLRPLSEVTNLNPKKFYNSFKDSKGQTCIESLAKFWQ